MDWRKIDKRLSQHHDREHFPIVTDALWDAIEPHIPQKQPTSKWLLALLLPAMLLMVGGAYYLGYVKASQDREGELAQYDSQVSTLSSLLSIANSSNNKIAETETPKSSVGEAQVNNSKPAANFTVDATYAGNAQYNITDRPQYNSTNTINNSILYDREQTAQSNINNTTIQDGNNNGIGLVSSHTSFALGQRSTKLVGSIDTEESINSEEENLDLSRLLSVISSLHIDELLIPETPKGRPYRSPYRKYRSNSPFYMELSAGGTRITSGLALADPSILVSNPGQMPATNLDMQVNELLRRRAAESKLLSFTGDLKLGYRLNDNWSLQTGLTFAQLAKSSASTVEFERQVEVDGVLIQEITTVNGVMQVFGTATVNERVTQRLNRINRYNQLLAPVSVLYRNQLDAIYFDLEVGGAISLAQNYNGFIHPSDIEEYSLTDDIDNLYRDGSNSYLILGGGLGIPFSDRLELIGRLNYYQHLNEISSPDYGIDEKLSFLKPQVGLRRNF